jgi:hypothetical protein
MKTSPTESVVKEWISELPFTQQALLMLSLRGPDGVEKYSGAKFILYFIRDVILKAAYPYDGKFEKGGFMRSDYENFSTVADAFFDDLDAYPMHFLMHFIHAAEVIGYHHPDDKIRNHWFNFYCFACECLHMKPENQYELNQRLKK